MKGNNTSKGVKTFSRDCDKPIFLNRVALKCSDEVCREEPTDGQGSNYDNPKTESFVGICRKDPKIEEKNRYFD